MRKGIFITFEGSEGCGKSTQSKLLCDWLTQQGRKVVFLREPGGTAISEKIRHILLDPAHKQMAQTCEMLLYMASRAQTMQEVVLPSLAGGAIVVCDRFLDSTRAYQGYGLGVPMKTINAIGAFATAGKGPDLTILLDVPLRQGLGHRAGCKDRIEQRSLAYHTRVRKGYFALARSYPRRIKIIRVAEDPAQTQERIRTVCRSLL